MKQKIIFLIGLLSIFLCLSIFAGNSQVSVPGENAEPAYKVIPDPLPRGEGVVRIILFSDSTCEECQKLKTKILPLLLKKYPDQIAIRAYDISEDPEGVIILWDRFEEKYGRTKESVPVIYMNGKVLDGFRNIEKNLEKNIINSLNKGGTPWPQPAPLKKEISSTKKIETMLGSLTIMAVIGAGLADGINPCAFTTIIFLISYLTMIGRSRRQILITGIIYTTAVFITYFALGIGLLKIIEPVVNINLAGRILYGITAGVSFVVAVLSIRDFTLAKQKRYRDMTLQLSDNMKRRIRKSIHSRVKGMGVGIAALVLGILVAMFELPCTGQVYLPIIAALSNKQLRSEAIPYLLLYNLMFIIPLVVVFIVAWYGVSSENIGIRFKKHVAGIKLAMSVIFLLMGTGLLYMAFY